MNVAPCHPSLPIGAVVSRDRTATAKWGRVVRAVLLATAFGCAVTHGASACTSSVNIAADDLNRAGRSTTVDEAQTRARRARASIEMVAVQTMSCCPMASMDFDDAATNARRASNEDDADQLAYHLRRAIRSFNSAVDALNMEAC